MAGLPRNARMGFLMAKAQKGAADDLPEDDGESTGRQEVHAAVQESHDHRARRSFRLSVAAQAATFAFAGAKHEEPKKDVAKPATFVDLPDVLVNLAELRRRPHAISESQDRARIARSDFWSCQIQPLMPRVMDAFQTYLRELRATDLDGSAGLYRLKGRADRAASMSRSRRTRSPPCCSRKSSSSNGARFRPNF